MPMNLNSTILAAAYVEGSNDYMQLTPAPTQSNMAEVIAAYEMPTAKRLFEETTGLFTTIGINSIESRRFEDPLAFLEGRYMPFGSHVVHTAHKWEKANAFSSDDQKLLKRAKDKFIQSFSGINRQDVYETSITRVELVRSLQPELSNGDGYGLDSMLGAKFDAIYSPEAYASMNMTLQIIGETEDAWGGLFKVNVPDVVDEQTGEEFMSTLAGLIYRWRFPSTIYNKMGYEGSFTRVDDIVILVEPETLAKLDFTTLVNVFQAERPEDLRRRIVTVPSFPIPNVRAVVADRRFFDIHRSFFSLENFYNPRAVTMNYYLHSQGVWAANPMYNIALLGDFTTTTIPTVKVVPSALTIDPFEPTVEIGGSVQIRSKITANISTTPTGISYGEIEPKPDSVTYELSVSEGSTLNRNTFVDRFGVLHVQKTGIAADAEITVKATSTYINPSGTTEVLTAEAIITVVEPATVDGDNTEDNQLAYTDIRDAKLKDTSIE